MEHGVTASYFNILAVDDDPSLLEIYRDILQVLPFRASAAAGSARTSAAALPSFRVTCCAHADAALEAVTGAFQTGAPFSAIFLDVNMPPGPSGFWAAERILKIDPTANIVLVTGFIGGNSGSLPRHLNLCDRLLFLQKPFHAQEIFHCASALSAKWLAEKQVRAMNVNLENLVQQRTAELQRKNEELRSEVEQRRSVQNALQESLGYLKKVIGGTVMAIATTVEKRDPYTSGHQQRVAQLARAIGSEMGLSADRIEGLTIASAIHDIGKISLPAEILSKPSQLNRLEMGLIQAHAQAGFDILKSVEFPWPIAQIVLQHHERLNGSGYPQGLSGEDILKEARIVGVADVLETMSSHRPYRPSIGLAKALEEISSNKGILYDPDAADACLSLIGEKRFEFSCPVFA